MQKKATKMLLCAASFAMLSLGASATENLVKNGDFHAIGGNGKFQDWKHGANVVVGKDKKNNFARISNSVPGEYVAISQDIEINSDWEKLALHVKMRINSLDEKTAKKPTDVPRAMLVFTTTSSSQKHFRPICHLAEKTDGKFVEIWQEVEIPPDSKTVRLVFDLPSTTGEFDVDDVELFADAPKGIPLSVLDNAGKFNHSRTLGVATPPNWITTYQIYSQEVPPVRIETEGAEKFLRVENKTPDKDIYCENYFKLDPSWKKVKISAKIRAKDLKCGSGVYHDARVMTTFTDEKGNIVGGYGDVPCVKADQDWKEISAVREVPQGASAIRLQIGLFHSSGTVDFDDISVSKGR